MFPFFIESCSECSDLDFRHIDVMDLADDVIDENSPLTSPHAYTSNEDLGRGTSRTLERSLSHDNYCHPRLRSILKRSKSDGCNQGTDTDDDVTTAQYRIRSTTYSDGNLYSEPENEFSRRRHKSVSFLDKPTVFEFTKMSKWQWKKQALKKAKQERERKTNKKKQAKGSNSDAMTTTASSTDEEKVVLAAELGPDKISDQKPPEKHGRKWKKAQKKRNRNNSEGRSTEEEADTLATIGQSEKKGKRKKKNNKRKGKNNHFEQQESDSVANESSEKPSLNNPLIFELD